MVVQLVCIKTFHQALTLVILVSPYYFLCVDMHCKIEHEEASSLLNLFYSDNKIEALHMQQVREDEAVAS